MLLTLFLLDEPKPIKLIQAALPLIRKYVKEELGKIQTVSKKAPAGVEDFSLSEAML